MCIDYTDLNKVCPKDSYPLPSIDELVDGAPGSELLSMMDAHSGYNQILMAKEDEEKTTLIKLEWFPLALTAVKLVNFLVVPSDVRTLCHIRSSILFLGWLTLSV